MNSLLLHPEPRDDVVLEVLFIVVVSGVLQPALDPDNPALLVQLLQADQVLLVDISLLHRQHL